MPHMKALIRLIIFFAFSLTTALAQSACNLEQIPFGSSARYVAKELGLTNGELLFNPNEDKPPSYFIEFPGDQFCSTDKTFEHTIITFVFLQDSLHKIVTERGSKATQERQLIIWAESIYGAKKGKPTAFYDPAPNATWLWSTDNVVILYSIIGQQGLVLESISIESKNTALVTNRHIGSDQ